MRTGKFIAFLLIASHVSYAQTAVSLDKLNVLYLGVENPITVATSEGSDQHVNVSIEGGGGSIKKLGDGKYSVRVNQITDECLIQVKVKNKIVGQFAFRVRHIPTPKAYIGGMQSGESMPAGQFRAQSGIGAGVLDFPFEIRYNIVSYRFICNAADGSLIEIPSEGAYFTPAVMKVIREHVKPGCFVMIRDIKAKGTEEKIFDVEPLIYYIK